MSCLVKQTHITLIQHKLLQVYRIYRIYKQHCRCRDKILTLSYLGGGGKICPLLFFLHRPKTAQGIKLRLSDFKDTPLRHLLQVKPVRYILSCCYGNKITEGTSRKFAPKKSEKSVICKDIELKFGIETKFGSLSSKSNINYNLTSL